MAGSKASSHARLRKPPRRGRPGRGDGSKVPLNLTLTPRARFYLQVVADHIQTSMSGVVEEFVAAMTENNITFKPLGRGQRRVGQKAMRGQPIYHGERKRPVNLLVTPATKRGLKRLARLATDPLVRPSMSDVIERHLTAVSELWEDCFPYPGDLASASRPDLV